MAGRIVVGIDGSDQSANALEWALARARLGGEQLDLVSVYSITPAVDFYGYHGLGSAEAIDWYAEYATQLLEAAAGRVREAAPDLTCTLASERGHAATVLTGLSEGASAVVVGRRGLGRAASAVLGSVSNRLTVQAKCPVVVVCDSEVPTTGPVVVGVDGSEFGTHALRYALAEAAVRHAPVRAVAAYDVHHPVFRADEELVSRIRAETEAEVAATIARSVAEAGGASTGVEEVAAEGRPADVILDHAHDAQLIVVGSHGRGLVRRVLLGSVSRQVLNDADRPIAVVDLPDA